MVKYQETDLRVMMDKWLVLSTRSKDQICGTVWSAAGMEGQGLERQVFDSEAALLDVVGAISGDYSRIIIDANLRRMGRDVMKLKEVPNLVVFDHDICQQYCPDSDWYRKYFPVIKQIGAQRVVVSSETLRRDMLEQGLDAVSVPKAYDPAVVSGMGLDRDVPAGFVGRLSNKVYRKRKKMLQMAHQKSGVALMRTEPGAAYNLALNRIAVFVNADIGFNEYMIKNFEAMAAGCALLAWRQPDCEQQALGFEDGVNVMLYSSGKEMLSRLADLTADPGLRERIACSGKALVEKRHRWALRGVQLQTAIAKPLRQAALPLTLSDRAALLGKL